MPTCGSSSTATAYCTDMDTPFQETAGQWTWTRFWHPTGGSVSIPRLPEMSLDGSCSSRCAVTRKRSSPRLTCRRSRVEATPMPGPRGVLHRADVHEVDLGNGVVIPVLPPSARVVE